MTITAQFVNETQGEDLKSEPILITVDSEYQIAFDISGTERKTFVATVNSLQVLNSYRNQNANDNEDNRLIALGKLFAITDAINNHVPTGIGVSLLKLISNEGDLSTLTYETNDYWALNMKRMTDVYGIVDAVLQAIQDQLGINIKE